MQRFSPYVQRPITNYFFRIPFTIVLVALISVLFNACVNPQKLVYFPNQQDTLIKSLPKPEAALIQENDVLSITVNSLNPTASATFNAPNAQALTTNSGLGTQTGYLVSNTGFITFPFLGQVKAAGFTTAQLADQLKASILQKGLLLDPIITIRQLNYHITLIGEVGRPGVYTIPSEKVNLLEALGQGGDLTPYANRKNVVLIREEGGQRQFHRIDLNSSKILTSPYYYLQANDILYAEPNKTRATAVSNQNQLINYGITAFSLLFTIVTFVISINR